MVEVFIGAVFGTMIGVVGGVYLVVKSIKNASKITETKIIDGHTVMFIYEN